MNDPRYELSRAEKSGGEISGGWFFLAMSYPRAIYIYTYVYIYVTI